jgi:hypothetical protein
MLKKTSLFAAVLLFLCCVCSAYAQKRGPSTPEERKRAVEMVNFLEANPFAKEAKDYRAALVYFVSEVPDITVTLCNVLGDTKRFKGDYESELFGALMFAQTKFIIENPDKAKDDEAIYLAGAEGAVRTWQSMKAAKPKAKFPLMDELLEKQKAGTFVEHVKENIKGCTKK